LRLAIPPPPLLRRRRRTGFPPCPPWLCPPDQQAQGKTNVPGAEATELRSAQWHIEREVGAVEPPDP
jgi:hypothetical protein